MFDSIYHRALKPLCNRVFWLENANILSYIHDLRYFKLFAFLTPHMTSHMYDDVA